MPQFDVAWARKAGYSDAEILTHLTSSRKFDVAGARKSGYKDAEIIDYLSKEKAPVQTSRVFTDILDRSTRNREADVAVRRMEQEPLKRPKVGGGPARPQDTLLGGLKQTFLDPLYRPLEEAHLAVSRMEPNPELAYSPEKEPIRYAIAAGAGEARRRSLGVLADVGLDPLNALPLGTLLSKGRPALRIGADLLFASVAEVGALQALKEGRYDDAAIQQAFALIGVAGAKSLSDGRKRLIFEEARLRDKARTNQQIQTDIGFYKKLSQEAKAKTQAKDAVIDETMMPEAEAAEVARFEELQRRAEPEAATPAASRETDKLSLMNTIRSQKGEPSQQVKDLLASVPAEKQPSTTASLYADLGEIRKLPAKGNANPTPEQASEYITAIRTAAETHLPEALEAVGRAEAAIQAGNMAAFANEAEAARGLLRKSYGERLAADEMKRQGLTREDSPADYSAAQKLIDNFEDRLEKKYGKNADLELIKAQTNKQLGITRGTHPDLQHPKYDFTPEELTESNRLYEQRDAFDKADVERNVAAIDEKFKPLIPDAAARGKFVRMIAEADLPAALRTENNPDAWKGVGRLANEIAQHISRNVTKDRNETAFSIDAVLGGTADSPGVQLRISEESGLGPSQRTIDETQRWLNHLYPQDPPQMPRRSKDASLGLTGGETFTEGDAPTLGGTPEEQMTRLAAGRKTEQLKEGKIFDEQGLVDSPLFGGRGGRQRSFADEIPDVPRRAGTETAVADFDAMASDAAETYMQGRAEDIEAVQGRVAKGHQVISSDEYSLLNNEGVETQEGLQVEHDRTIRPLGGKIGTPLEKFPESPGVLAKAIRNGKGKLYDRIKKAFLDDVVEREGNDIRKVLEFERRASEPGELQAPLPENPDLSFDFGDNLLKSLDSMETAARERLAARGDKGRMGSEKGASPILDDINDLITIGVAKIGKGTIRFAKWSAEMISEFGDRIRPHLQEIYSKSMERARELKDFKADEYFNFRRVKNLSEGEKQRLIDRATEETLATGRVPKEKITFDQVREEAKQIGGDDILKFVDQAQKGASEYRAARFAMRQRINALNSEVVDLRTQVAAITDPAQAMALERDLLQKESDLGALLDSHMRLRSEEGRNLAINRMQADSTWDLGYWMARARSAIGVPPGVELPPGVRDEIQVIHAEGQKARQEMADAERVETTWGTQPDLPAGHAATMGPFPGPTPTPPIPSTPVQTTWGTQPGLPGIPGQTPAPATPTGSPGQPPPAVRARVTRARRAVQQANQNMAQAVTKLQKTGWLETISSLRKAGLFGVFTRVRNIGANMGFQVAEEISRLPAVLVDMAVNLGGGDRQVQGISPRAISRSAYYAATQGLRDAGDAIRYGVTTNELGRVEVQKPVNSGIRWLDKFANFQFREMAAEDRIFKSYAFRRSLEEQLWLNSRKLGYPMPNEAQVRSAIAGHKAAGQGGAKLPALTIPSDKMIANAIAYAEFATFNNRNMIASAIRSGQATMKGKGTAGEVGNFVVDMIVPFANTPANVIARQFEYSPINIFKTIDSAFRMASGRKNYGLEAALGNSTRRTFEQALGRGLTGSALIYLGWKLSEKGLATGTWEEEAGQRNVAEAAGRTPGAVRVGDRWIGTGQLAPVGSLVMVGAALQREATQPLKNELMRPGKLISIGGKAASEQPFLAGMSNLIEAIENPGNRGERFFSGMIGSFYPTYLSEVSAGFDPYMRDVRPEGVGETLTKGAVGRTPGRFSLPERLDVLGQPRLNTTIGSPALEITDPIRNALQENSISVGFPQRQPDETQTAYRLRSQFVGRLIDERVGRVLQRPGYPAAPVERRREWIDKAVAEAREQASQTLDRKFASEEIREKFLLDQIDRVESRLKSRPALIPPAPRR